MLLVFVLVSVYMIDGSRAWRNSYDNPLFFSCPAHQVLNNVRSEHDNDYEDRRWNLNCRYELGQRSCSWSGIDQIAQQLI